MKLIIKILFVVIIITTAQMVDAGQPINEVLQKTNRTPSMGPINFRVKNHESMIGGPMRLHVFRLRPGEDLLTSLKAYVKHHHIQAAVVLSAVGSLTQTAIRYANQPRATVQNGHFEIVSITGTIEETGEHIHLAVGTEQGNVIGGHLMTGCKIYTTCEIVLGELTDIEFKRELDITGSGWNELKIYPKGPK